MKYALLFSLILLGGCATNRPVLEQPNVGTIILPTEDRLACPVLPAPPPGPMDEQEVGLLFVTWANLYDACASSKSRILRVIDLLNAQNTKS